MKQFLTALPMAALVAAAPAWPAPDDLDPAFGSGGRVTLEEGYELEPVTGLVPLPGDEVLAIDPYTLWRVSPDGTRRERIGLASVCRTMHPDRSCWPAGVARQRDGKLVVGFTVQPFAVGVARHGPDGQLDTGFGNGGIASPVPTPRRFYVAGIAVQGDGSIVIAGSVDTAGTRQSFALVRFLASGAPDLAFGNAGYLQLPVDGSAFAVLQTADHKLVLSGHQFDASRPFGATILARLLPNGELDTGFAVYGVYRDASAFAAGAFAEQPDGKLVLAGSIVEGGIERIALSRVDAQGRLDSTFGVDGTVVLSVEEGHGSAGNAVALDATGRIVVAGRVTPVLEHPRGLWNHRIAVARFHRDGAPDTFFAGGGVTTFWSGGGSAHAVMITSSNGILVGGAVVNAADWQHPALFRLKGGEGSVMRAVREAIAVEYVHAAFGNYFLTTSFDEMRVLETMPDLWRRTGSSFRVWAGDDPDLAPACRFFSGQSFAPRFSHFFTPYADECAMLRARSTWTFEGEVFRLRLPESWPYGYARDSSPHWWTDPRDCPAGSARLYRLYNNGKDGVPRHRYTGDVTSFEFQQMLADGWTFEGDAQTKVFACIPPS